MSQTPSRRLGPNGPVVSALGFGCMGLSEFYGTPPTDEERFKILDRAVALGATVFDTSDTCKSPSIASPIPLSDCSNLTDKDNEDILARWFKHSGARDKIFLCTKFGFSRGADGKPAVCTSPEYARQACDKSLKRLGVDKM